MIERRREGEIGRWGGKYLCAKIVNGFLRMCGGFVFWSAVTCHCFCEATCRRRTTTHAGKHELAPAGASFERADAKRSCRPLTATSRLRESGDESPHSKTGASFRGSKIIVHLQPVGFEAVDCLHHRRSDDALEPRSRAPFVLVRHRNETVVNRVLMDVIQPREVGAFKRQPRVSKVVPDFAALRAIEFVEFAGGVSVEMFYEFREALRLRTAARDEVVVVGEDGPRLDLPAVEIGFGKQVKFEQVEACAAAKE